MTDNLDPLIPADASDVERCWLKTRWQTFHELPLESALSLPVPVIDSSEGLCLSGFYYGVSRGTEKGSTVIKTPLARMISSYPEGQVISFRLKKDGILFPGLPDEGQLGIISAGTINPSDRVRNRKELYRVISETIISFSQNIPLTLDEKSTLLVLWNQIVEEPLLPYYEMLNPDFFRWLERGKI